MQQRRKRSRLIIGLLALGLLAGAALTAGPAQADSSVDPAVSDIDPLAAGLGPYYALPSWDQKIGAVNRFVVLTNWASAAVLDKETGLVWERRPSTGLVSWAAARLACTARTTGGHKGWRLPSVHELASLVDPTRQNPALPASHPFTNVQSAFYWSASTNAALPTDAWDVHFNDGGVEGHGKANSIHAWCVRGEHDALAVFARESVPAVSPLPATQAEHPQRSSV